MESNLAQSRLRQHLLEAAPPPGSKVQAERELAAALKVSRPALREAIRRLVHLGLLERRRGAGTFVAAVDFLDLLRVRQQLEPLAAEQAALRRSAADLGELQSLVLLMRDHLDDSERFADADMRLHERVAAASGNRVLAQIIGDLTDVLQLSRQQTAQDLGVRRASLKDLTTLVGHIEAQRPEAASAAMASHLAAIGRALCDETVTPTSRAAGWARSS